MLCRSVVCLTQKELRSSITAGRQELIGQFASMEGWQAGQSERFDAYMREKRRAQRFDGFDQRVERAFRLVCKQHKTEVVNSFKRQLKDQRAKFDAQKMIEMQQAIEDRTVWLRDVWAQVDADYRSEDPARQQVAAKEISAALAGEPGEHMAWVYDQKQRERFAGPKERMEMENELAAAHLPSVSADEVHRYQNLQLRMETVEDGVKSRFGVAGIQHWADLQAEKDRLYEEKLERSASIFRKLLDQSARYDESRRTALLRSHVERVHQAQVRFKASMELEKEREEMVLAHTEMEAERQRVMKEDRLVLLREAADLKARGIPTPQIALAMKERQLERYSRRQAEYQLAEQQRLREKQTEYRSTLRQLQREVEEREGSELLRQSSPAAGLHTTLQEHFTGDHDPHMLQATNEEGTTVPVGADSERSTAQQTPSRTLSHYSGSKKALWDDVNRNKYEDPFLTVHQARLDAVKQYDSIYSKYFPTSLALGKKYSRQNVGEEAAGNEMDKQVFQKPGFVMEPYQWGMRGVHDLDSDGSVQYLTYTQHHVRDSKTGDIDWRYEKKKGGPVFRGPKLYRMGAEREAKDPSEQPVDPSFSTWKGRGH